MTNHRLCYMSNGERTHALLGTNHMTHEHLSWWVRYHPEATDVHLERETPDGHWEQIEPAERAPTQDAAVEDLADQLRACRTPADAYAVVLEYLDEAGVGQLAYDPLKPGAVVYTDHDLSGNPIRHVIHRTYEGRLVWICGHCLCFSLEPTDGTEWTCCGQQDGDAMVSQPITCTNGDGECLLAGTDDCLCHETNPDLPADAG